MGYYSFGQEDEYGDSAFPKYKSLGEAMWSLWCYTTLDGWMDILWKDGDRIKRIEEIQVAHIMYTIACIFFVHYIFVSWREIMGDPVPMCHFVDGTLIPMPLIFHLSLYRSQQRANFATELLS